MFHLVIFVWLSLDCREPGVAAEGDGHGWPVQLDHRHGGHGGHRPLQLRGGQHPRGDRPHRAPRGQPRPPAPPRAPGLGPAGGGAGRQVELQMNLRELWSSIITKKAPNAFSQIDYTTWNCEDSFKVLLPGWRGSWTACEGWDTGSQQPTLFIEQYFLRRMI